MKQQKGFTLIELMIAVAIVSILAAVVVPSYNEYVVRGKIQEATSELAGMRVKLEQYFQDSRTYVGACAAGTVAPLPGGTQYFTFACNLTATTFIVTATGIAAQGTGGFVYTINEQNAKATTGVPSGWTTNATCWVTKKGGSC